MDFKKIISWVLVLPMYLLIIGSFFGACYAAYSKIQGVTWSTPIILAGIMIAYGIGIYLRKLEQ